MSGPELPFPLRAAITRATFHALEGEPALVPTIAEQIEAELAALDPSDAPVLAPQIGEAIHSVVMGDPDAALSPLRRLVFARRLRRLRDYRAAIRARRREIAARFPGLAWVMLCDPDPAVAAAAGAALPEPPSPFHAALLRARG